MDPNNQLKKMLDEIVGIDEYNILRIANGIENLGFDYNDCLDLEWLLIQYQRLTYRINKKLHLINTDYFDSSYECVGGPYGAMAEVETDFYNFKKQYSVFNSYFCKYNPELKNLDFDAISNSIFNYKNKFDYYISKFAESEALEKAELTKKQTIAFVYVIKDTVSEYYKIGCSKKPKDRLRTLQLSTGNKLKLVYSCEVTKAYKHEQKLHDIFASKRLASEWFGLDDNDIKTIKLYLENVSN